MFSLMRLVHSTCGLVLLGLALFENFQFAEAKPFYSGNAERSVLEGRQRISLNNQWRFSRFTSSPDSLTYETLKPWILPSSNEYIVNGTQYTRPSGPTPGSDLAYVQSSFRDVDWEIVNTPHDWAIKGPFNAPGVPHSQGSLPVDGVGWYRRAIPFAPSDERNSLYLEIDGAQSYAAVWINGILVGGWPYGYNSFRLDLSPYIRTGDNVLAIRLDNPTDFSRWYPGAGLFRNIWLIKTDQTHVGYHGTYITTPEVSAESATVDLTVEIENTRNTTRDVDVVTEIHVLDRNTGQPSGDVVATFPRAAASVAGSSKQAVKGSVTIANPQLWGPPPSQEPNLYVATTTVRAANGTELLDRYETQFGIRTVTYDATKGIGINGEFIRIQGTNNHHDLGSIGAAFNTRAQERQFELLQELGCNALRTSHNPPAPEFLDLADRLGFVVLDEIFDVWRLQKVASDYHLLFDEWHEADLRTFIRRDRNHPSVIAWSFGNEIQEQTNPTSGATAIELRDIVRAEDPTRQSTSAMNSAQAGSTFADALDIESLNYQGEGRGDSFVSSFPSFREAYPDKLIWSTESASTLSTRGTYVFPVTSLNSSVVSNTSGLDTENLYVSAYDLYSPSWAASPDKVFGAQDKHPYVAGEFVWTGWDYIGEPTPFDPQARSSYFGIIDLAGFKKDRFYLYQARWRPDLVSSEAIAHILPHWTWPDRVGEVTPVHVFSGADEAELFVNGKSAGRLQKIPLNYRFRWDNVIYEPGELHVVTYKDGVEYATDTVRTVGEPAKLNLTADRTSIDNDGYDLSFITVAVVDANGDTVPEASNAITFSISGPGEIVSTDNGNPADYVAFPSLTRDAFSGLALAVVRAEAGRRGEVVVSAAAEGLEGAQVTVRIG